MMFIEKGRDMLLAAKAIGKTAKATHVAKEVGIAGTGLSALWWVQYIEQIINPIIGMLCGLCTLVYLFIRAKKALKGKV